MKKAIILAKLITSAYPEDMRLLYQEHGITAPVSAKSFIDAYIVLGDSFLMKAFEIAWENGKQSRFSGVDGTSLETDKLNAYQASNASAADALAESKEKSGFLDSVLGIFDKVGDAAGTVSSIYTSIDAMLNGTKTTSQSDAQTAMNEYLTVLTAQQQQQSANNTTTVYIIIGVVVVVILLFGGLMIMKKK